MKKFIKLTLVCLLICVFLVALCACSNSDINTVDNTDTIDNTDTVDDTDNTFEEEVVSEEEYYKMVYTGNFEYGYYIYDANKNIVEEEKGLTNLLDVTLLNDNVVDVHINLGSGLSEHSYYSVERDAFSKKYLYVSAYNNEKVAYLNGSFQDRRLIVQNVFDKTEYYKEFDLDFSTFFFPVVEASFINNDSQLQVTYYSGEEEIQRTEILDL